MTQSNVAVAVGASTAAHGATTIATSSQALPALAGVPSVPLPDVPALVAAVAAEAIVDLPSPVAAVAPLIEQGTEAISTFPGLAGSLDEPLEIPFVPAMLARPFVFPAAGFASRPLVPGRSVLAPAVGTASGIAVAAERSHGALTSGEASGRTGAAPPHADRGRDAGRPRWHAPERPALPEPAPSAASAAPATGGGSSNGGIPIFLALPFLAAMLDLARRVVPVGMALPSGHRSRVPDDPG